mgnify:CR=1 FL=1
MTLRQSQVFLQEAKIFSEKIFQRSFISFRPWRKRELSQLNLLKKLSVLLTVSYNFPKASASSFTSPFLITGRSSLSCSCGRSHHRMASRSSIVS